MLIMLNLLNVGKPYQAMAIDTVEAHKCSWSAREFHDSINEIEFGSGGEEMVKDVQLGDNAAVRC